MYEGLADGGDGSCLESESEDGSELDKHLIVTETYEKTLPDGTESVSKTTGYTADRLPFTTTIRSNDNDIYETSNYLDALEFFEEFLVEAGPDVKAPEVYLDLDVASRLTLYEWANNDGPLNAGNVGCPECGSIDPGGSHNFTGGPYSADAETKHRVQRSTSQIMQIMGAAAMFHPWGRLTAAGARWAARTAGGGSATGGGYWEIWILEEPPEQDEQ